jgi:hypothetical protein
MDATLMMKTIFVKERERKERVLALNYYKWQAKRFYCKKEHEDFKIT